MLNAIIRNGVVNDVDDAVNGVVNDAVNLTASEQNVLQYISTHSQATIQNIADSIGRSKTTVDRAIRSLKKKGMLDRKGSDKTGEWLIKK